MAERKPAAASSGVESAESARLGVAVRISLLDASYAYTEPCVRAHKPLPSLTNRVPRKRARIWASRPAAEVPPHDITQ
jgi:hypothetical protein